MAVIVRDPALADTIALVESKAADGAEAARRRYEDGDVVLLSDVRLDLDYDFLNTVSFDGVGGGEVGRKVKKFSSDDILAIDPKSKSEVAQLVLMQVFGGDQGRLRTFQEQVRRGNSQIEELVSRLFPAYRMFKKVLTWRFTTTLFENLHWDNFHTDEDFQQVRVFVNVDSSPRLWRISHKIDDYMKRHYAKQNLSRWARETPDRFVFQVNNKVLGGMQRPLMDGLPTHHIAFEQGDVWLAETRIASHQIYSGRRAIATMFYSSPQTMDAPDKRFVNRVKRMHEDASPLTTGTE